MQIFPKYLFLNLIIKNICCRLFKNLLNWSPHFFTSFSKPAGIPTDSCENSTAAEMDFNSYPNIKQKWIWFKMFLSEIYESAENGSRGVFFLISGFLQCLTHSAMVVVVMRIHINGNDNDVYNVLDCFSFRLLLAILASLHSSMQFSQGFCV